MITPNQMMDELRRIKSAADQIEIKGSANANFILYICQKCDFLIETLDEVLKEKTSKESVPIIQNDTVEVGE